MKISIENVSIIHTNLGWTIRDKTSKLYYTNNPEELWVKKEDSLNILYFKDTIKTLDFIYKINKN